MYIKIFAFVLLGIASILAYPSELVPVEESHKSTYNQSLELYEKVKESLKKSYHGLVDNFSTLNNELKDESKIGYNITKEAVYKLARDGEELVKLGKAKYDENKDYYHEKVKDLFKKISDKIEEWKIESEKDLEESLKNLESIEANNTTLTY